VTITEYFDIAAFALAVPSLGFAYKTIRDCQALARQLSVLLERNQRQTEFAEVQNEKIKELIGALAVQDGKANKLTGMLESVGKALTTQYIGDFPSYLPYVNKLIERSTGQLRIATTMLGHGSFTDPENWHKTRAALDKAGERKIDIHVLCVNHDLRRQLFKAQYPEAFADLPGVLKQNDGELASKILTFIDRDVKPTALTPETFLDMIMEEEDRIKAEVFRKADKVESDRFLPFYLWIADETEAIFAFPTHSVGSVMRSASSVATAFLTKDRDIVRALIQVFNRLESEVRTVAVQADDRLPNGSDLPSRGPAPS
jgi:hypothetical protein